WYTDPAQAAAAAETASVASIAEVSNDMAVAAISEDYGVAVASSVDYGSIALSPSSDSATGLFEVLAPDGSTHFSQDYDDQTGMGAVYLSITSPSETWIVRYTKYSGAVDDGYYMVSPKVRYGDVSISIESDGWSYESSLYYARQENMAVNQTVSLYVTVTAPIAATGVTLNTTSVSLLPGATRTLTATVTPSDADDKSVSWSSSNTSVATVSSSGVVTAVSAGSATITVTTTSGGYTATCAVTVQSTAVTGVTLSNSTMSLIEGGSQTLYATVSPSYAANTAVSWSTSNSSIATVSSSGLVTAIAAGSATITVTTSDGSYTDTCAVTVVSSAISVTGVSVSPTTVSLLVNETYALTATVLPSNATNSAVTWSTSDASVATVSAGGVITTIGGGAARITATTADGSYTAYCVVSVTADSSDDDVVTRSGEVIWYCQGAWGDFTTEVDSWSEVVQWNGEDGADGTNGTNGLNGTDGSDGDPGPSIAFQSDWVAGATYYGNSTRTDVVKYSGVYYRAKIYGSSLGYFANSYTPSSASGSTYFWESFGANFESVATQVLFAEKAVVENLVVRELETSSGKVKIEDDGSITAEDAKITGSLTQPYKYLSSGESISSTDFTDNVIYYSSYGEILGNLPIGTENNGRLLRIIHGRNESGTLPEGWVQLGYYNSAGQANITFYERDASYSYLMISREIVELLGYGHTSTQGKWIVLNRTNVEPNHRFGLPMRILALGLVLVDNDAITSQTIASVDGRTFTVTRTGEGKYTVRVTDYGYWGDISTLMVACQAVDSSQRYVTVLSASESTYYKYWYLGGADDDSNNDTGFYIYIYSTLSINPNNIEN
ncbi:MAG: Ig-like domain-containing protein, partial [Rikenellaceae bacterium]